MAVRFNGNVFDLTSTPQEFRVNEISSGSSTSVQDPNDTAGIDYIVVKSKEPLDKDQRDHLVSLGLEFKEYLSGNNWLCRWEPADISPIRSLPYIEEAVKFPAHGKIQSSLNQTTETESSDRTVDIILHEHRHKTVDEIIEEMSQIIGTPVSDFTKRRNGTMLRVDVDGDKLGRLLNVAEIDSVAAIQEVVPLQLYNNLARITLKADTMVNTTKFRGKDQLITVADTGFDTGDANNPHPAFTGRVRKLIPVGRPKETDDTEGHGTHVCGSVLGSGVSKLMGGNIEGTAPEAELVVQALSGPNRWGQPVLFGTSKQGIRDILLSAYDLGSRVHTNSWGPVWRENSREPLSYNSESQDIDKFVWEHKDMVVCFAAGNDGEVKTSKNQIGAQSAAKNCITVGSCDNSRPSKDDSFKVFDASNKDPSTSKFMGNPDNVSVYSSRGPTREGRIKPDVVAPGSMILSTASRKLVKVSTTFGETKDKLFMFDTGTSMATPLVAGCVAVLREALQEGGLVSPSAALLKALLINGATNINKPVSEQGFGRVNLENSIIVPGVPSNRDFWEQEIRFKTPKDSEKKLVPLKKYRDAEGLSTLKVTLVYMDQGGATVQNRLHLAVHCKLGNSEQTRIGNAGDKQGADAYDQINTVEQVVWSGLPADATITIEVLNVDEMLALVVPFAVVWSVHG